MTAHLVEALQRGVALGDQLEAGALPAGSGVQRVRGEHLAVAGDDRERHRRHRGGRGMRGAGRREVVHDQDVREDAEHAGRGRHDARRGRRARDARIRHRGGCSGCDHDVVGAGDVVRDGEPEGGLHVVHEHALGERAEHGRDRRLEARL